MLIRYVRGSRMALLAAVLSVAAPVLGEAPKPIQEADIVTVTATVEAIDHTNRRLTLRGETGVEVTVAASSDVQRFHAIKVGDVVTARYIESVVVRVVPPGEPPSPASAAGQAVTRRAGEKPGATIADQVNLRVKVQAIDKAAPSLTVVTPAGREMSFKVKDKARLEKVNVGDEIEVTYTEALLITVDAKK